MSRLADVVRFYALLDRLERRLGGTRTLATFHKYRDWPHRGLYLFFEPSEVRQESGVGPRVIRIGTHAVTAGSTSTLRQRLRQHRGQASGNGNHRGSIFRLLVGQALMARGDVAHCASWGVKGHAGKAAVTLNTTPEALAAAEAPIELAVTSYLSTMPFLWVEIDDTPSPKSLRGVIERNAIALLSNHNGPAIDPASSDWLGHFSDRPQVRASGLWNQRHVGETYNPVFLEAFESAIERREKA
jgi:hypothetical protein